MLLDPEFEALLGPAPAEGGDVTADTLAAFLGLSVRRIAQLADEGVIAKSGYGAFPLQSSVRAYIESLRVRSARPASTEAERLKREQADAVALKNAATRRELIPARDVESAWSIILRDVRASMLALPSRIQQRLSHLSTSDISEIDREIRAALSETGRG